MSGTLKLKARSLFKSEKNASDYANIRIYLNYQVTHYWSIHSISQGWYTGKVGCGWV